MPWRVEVDANCTMASTHSTQHVGARREQARINDPETFAENLTAPGFEERCNRRDAIGCPAL